MSGLPAAHPESNSHGVSNRGYGRGSETASLQWCQPALPAPAIMSGPYQLPPTQPPTPPSPAHYGCPPPRHSFHQPMRMPQPLSGSSPPPASGHITPWGHTPHNPGTGSLGGLYMGSHMRWSGPASVKPPPTPVPGGGPNPLYSLQMLFNNKKAQGETAGDCQQETMDLSAGGECVARVIEAAQEERAVSPLCPVVSNGEVTKDPNDSVASVIAANPLSESKECVRPQQLPEWENSNHTADHVELILENMFQTQTEEDKGVVGGNSGGGGKQSSVIVANDLRPAAVADVKAVLETSPAKEEPRMSYDAAMEADVMEDDVKEEDLVTKDPNDTITSKENDDMLSSDVKDSEDVLLSQDLASMKDHDNSVALLQDSIAECKESDGSLSEEAVDDSERGGKDEPTSTMDTTTFIKVESELAKMFAGIADVPATSKKEEEETPIPGTTALHEDQKKPKRPKPRSIPRRPSDVFGAGASSVEGSPVKKRAKRPSEVERRAKRMKQQDSDMERIVLKRRKGGQVRGGETTNDGGKSRGPFIHIEGSKESPTCVMVINSGIRPEEDEGVEKAVAKRKQLKHPESKAAPRSAGLYNSTLSQRYDTATPDLTWLCALCKRGPHCRGGLGGRPAGDLYGPYTIPAPDASLCTLPPPPDKELAQEQARRGHGRHKSLRAAGPAATAEFLHGVSKRSKRSSGSSDKDALVGLTSIVADGKTSYEVWLHEQCAVWAPGVYLVGPTLVGLGEAVWAAVHTRCWGCGEGGASLGCVKRGCNARFHYGCALDSGWNLDVETFIAKCNTHSQNGKRPTMCRSNGLPSLRHSRNLPAATT